MRPQGSPASQRLPEPRETPRRSCSRSSRRESGRCRGRACESLKELLPHRVGDVRRCAPQPARSRLKPTRETTSGSASCAFALLTSASSSSSPFRWARLFTSLLDTGLVKAPARSLPRARPIDAFAAAAADAGNARRRRRLFSCEPLCSLHSWSCLVLTEPSPRESVPRVPEPQPEESAACFLTRVSSSRVRKGNVLGSALAFAPPNDCALQASR